MGLTPADLVTVLIAVLGGGVGLWGFLSKRVEAKAAQPAAMVTAEAGTMSAAGDLARNFAQAAVAMLEPVSKELVTVRDRLDAKTAEFDAKVARFETKLAECEESHRGCEAKYAELEQQFFLLKAAEPSQPYLPGLVAGRAARRAD